MSDFIHHPDGYVAIQETVFPDEFWNIAEPDYTLPEGYIGRLFTAGVMHHLICEGNAKQDQADIHDPQLSAYVARKAVYEEAHIAWRNGAVVENVAGELVITDPPAN